MKNIHDNPPAPLIHTASYAVEVYIGLKFWHCINFLTSRRMLYTPCIAISVSSKADRRFEGPVSPHRLASDSLVAEARVEICSCKKLPVLDNDWVNAPNFRGTLSGRQPCWSRGMPLDADYYYIRVKPLSKVTHRDVVQQKCQQQRTEVLLMFQYDCRC